MAISTTKSAILDSDGDSDWVKLGENGSNVAVDAVDASGVSTTFSATAALLFSPDGKMRCQLSDASGDITGKTDGFSRRVEGPGYVAVAATGVVADIKISVVDGDI